MPNAPRILVTGATGLVGGAVARALRAQGAEVHGGGRQAGAPAGWAGPWRPVDLERPAGEPLGDAYDAVFILRPPALTDPAPFAALAAGCGPATRLVFLSVQGAGSRAWLPHARIEKVLAASGRPCHALRPGYFMENLSGALAPLLAGGVLRLPAGDLAFNWTAVDDIAEAAATLLLNGGPGACELSGSEALGFGPALAQVSEAAGVDLAYQPIGLGRYLAEARGRGEAWGYIGVQLLLHWWPRWAGQDPVAGDPQGLLGRAPTALRAWAREHAPALRALRPMALVFALLLAGPLAATESARLYKPATGTAGAAATAASYSLYSSTRPSAQPGRLGLKVRVRSASKLGSGELLLTVSARSADRKSASARQARFALQKGEGEKALSFELEGPACGPVDLVAALFERREPLARESLRLKIPCEEAVP